MNVKQEIVIWPKQYKPIPKPYHVVRADDHFLVCTVDEEGNLLEEISVIHWNKFIVRRWAFEFAKEKV